MSENKHINNISQETFVSLLCAVKDGNSAAHENLFFVASRVTRTWCRHRKIEDSWIASDRKIISPEKVVHMIIGRYIDNHSISEKCSFGSFREFLVDEFNREINKGFENFIALLKKNDQQAWKSVFCNLEKKAALWFYKRTHIVNGDFRLLYLESVEMVHRNLSQKELHFTDSSEFKSYYFRVLEIKFLEYSRNNFSRRFRPLEEADNSDNFVQDSPDSIEAYENHLLLTRALQNLEPEERYILTEYYFCERKLNEIAAEMNISEGNIRVRKFRALQKLSGFLTKHGYGS